MGVCQEGDSGRGEAEKDDDQKKNEKDKRKRGRMTTPYAHGIRKICKLRLTESLFHKGTSLQGVRRIEHG